MGLRQQGKLWRRTLEGNLSSEADVQVVPDRNWGRQRKGVGRGGMNPEFLCKERLGGKLRGGLRWEAGVKKCGVKKN